MRRLAFLLVLLAALPVGAQAPSYSRQVQPFFTRYCVECHNGKEAEGELSLDSYKALLAGGDKGAAIEAGKPDASLLVRLLEGKAKPKMPPAKAKQPTAAEVAVVRAWVLDGAKDDGAAKVVRLAAIAPKTRVGTPVSAMACSPDGKTLAVSGRGEVLLVDADTGATRARLSAGRDRVSAIAFDAGGTVLAVAAGTAGAVYEVRVWRLTGGTWSGPGAVAATHSDVIHQLAFSPDGKLIASASYDRLVKVWDLAENKERHTLKDHSDSVYGVSFSPDGKLLASGGADRAVKVWDVTTGIRLYTLGESTDWVYAVAWSPTGHRLAAAGVDRSIRIWEADAKGGTIVKSAFAHEKAVSRLLYTGDGKTLYSLGEDNLAKSWDALTLTERVIYPRQAETPLSMALRAKPEELLLGLYDGVVNVRDAKTGKVERKLLPAAPKPPTLGKITPSSVQRGKATSITLTGEAVEGGAVVSDLLGLTANVAHGKAMLNIPATAKPGRYSFAVKTAGGTSKPQVLHVDRFAPIEEVEPNDSAKAGQAITLPATIAGTISRAGDLDWFRFESRAGEEVGVEALASKFDPVLTLVDPAGNAVAESIAGHLGHRCARAGTYALGIRDRDFRGTADMTYRLSVGPVPVVTSYFPLGVRQGTTCEIALEGVHLGKGRSARVEIPKTATPGSRVPVNIATPEGPALGTPSLVVGEFAEVADADKGREIVVPGTANGRIAVADAAQTWRFAAKKGTRLLLEVNASRLASPMDSTIEILDAAGRPLPRAVLRSTARTYVAFRDHDSRSPGIRLETWGELAVNDFLLVGNELLKIRALPRGPDDDAQFFAEPGGRLGYLGTTPVHQSQGSTMYKVTAHPPGTTFPANGLPLVTLFWRNDDGGPGFGKDSRLVFDPPTDGLFQVRVTGARGEGGPAHAYRLTIRHPRPDFGVSVRVAGTVSKCGAVPVRVDVTRLDEFDGVVDVKFPDLPLGFSAPATNILGDDDGTVVSLSADAKAVAPTKPGVLRVEARATIGGKVVTHSAEAKLPHLVELGDIVTTMAESEAILKPGGEVRLTVEVSRRAGFEGRIPVEVQGLPFGVRVLDVGLNGILITPAETKRTVVLVCEPWMKPTDHPIVIFARHERKGTEHAARSVLLRVTK
jgi:Planctomycete cytochrome C/WD domain, G-beta repeat